MRERVRELGLSGEDPLAELVLRHERQHAETMLQTLALAALDGWAPPLSPQRSGPAARQLSGVELVEVPAARIPIGASADGFAYDNERPQHEVEVEAFAIGRVPVTNDDWSEFIGDGGYARREWWSDEGWAWRTTEQADRPLQWREGGREQRLDGLHPVEGAAPVLHVSFFEAEAFARGRGLRLPSELEWELAATWDAERSRKLAYPWGDEPPEPRLANLIESAVSRRWRSARCPPAPRRAGRWA